MAKGKEPSKTPQLYSLSFVDRNCGPHLKLPLQWALALARMLMLGVRHDSPHPGRRQGVKP